MTTLEELGLLKMDFLGLRNLTVIQNAVNLIHTSQKEADPGITEEKLLDIDQIDFDDKAVLASLGTGRTDGVFQLESAGMKKLYERIKAPEPGGHHCGNFFVPSRAYGLYPSIYPGKE